MIDGVDTHHLHQELEKKRSADPRNTLAAGGNIAMPRGSGIMRTVVFLRGPFVLPCPLAEVYSIVLAAGKKRAAKTIVASNESLIQRPAIPAKVVDRAERGNLAYANSENIGGAA
jgi:hypothetical protein